MIEPVDNKTAKAVIFTPQATKGLYSFFHYGERHPSNLYEQQVALIGKKFDDIFLIKFVVPALLYNRFGNLATMDNLTISQILDEVLIINDNTSKSDAIYRDSFGNVEFLGFAHSHPGDTEFRFSINDTKNHLNFVQQFGDFLSILVNPQKEKIVCFSGKDCMQAKLILTYK